MLNSPPNVGDKSRLAYLDSVRGIAAMGVVFSHFFLAYGFPRSISFWITNSPLHIFWDGFAAVSMFFVLSGFVLSAKYFSSPVPLPNYFFFAGARFVRIWIPFFATLAISFAMYTIFSSKNQFFTIESDWIRTFWTKDYSFESLLKQTFLFQNSGENRLIPQDWTLTQELNLSLLLPAFVWIALRTTLGIFGLMLALMYWLKMPILTFHFVLGILLAKHREAALVFLKSSALRIIVFIFGLFFYTFRFSVPILFPQLIPEHRIWYVTGIGSLLLLLFVLAEPRAQRLLCRPAVASLGAISYAIYLIHFSILLVLAPRILFFYQVSAWLM